MVLLFSTSLTATNSSFFYLCLHHPKAPKNPSIIPFFYGGEDLKSLTPMHPIRALPPITPFPIFPFKEDDIELKKATTHLELQMAADIRATSLHYDPYVGRLFKTWSDWGKSIRDFRSKEIIYLKERLDEQSSDYEIIVAYSQNWKRKYQQPVVGVVDLIMGVTGEIFPLPPKEILIPPNAHLGKINLLDSNKTSTIKYAYLRHLGMDETLAALKVIRYAVNEAKAKGASHVYIHVRNEDGALSYKKQLQNDLGFQVVMEKSYQCLLHFDILKEEVENEI